MQLLKIYKIFGLCLISLSLFASQQRLSKIQGPLKIDVSEEVINQLYGSAKLLVTYNVQNQLPWGPNSTNTIYFYHKDKLYYEFTNFFPSKVYADGVIWPTSEHYYQAMKFTHHSEIQKNILNIATARNVFDYVNPKDPGKKDTMQKLRDKKWQDRSIQTMIKIVWLKFNQYEGLKKLLLSTENAVLVEDSPIDELYGRGKSPQDYRGKNWLGCILMAVREKLREQDEAENMQNIPVVKPQGKPTGQSNMLPKKKANLSNTASSNSNAPGFLSWLWQSICAACAAFASWFR